jgi:hypothetical protein
MGFDAFHTSAWGGDRQRRFERLIWDGSSKREQVTITG